MNEFPDPFAHDPDHERKVRALALVHYHFLRTRRLSYLLGSLAFIVAVAGTAFWSWLVIPIVLAVYFVYSSIISARITRSIETQTGFSALEQRALLRDPTLAFRSASDRNESWPAQPVTPPESLPVGTFVIATRNVGPIRDGQPGIVTSVVEQGFAFWKRSVYLCTFFGNVKVAMKPNEVSDFDHGYSREQLDQSEDPTLSVAEQLERIRPLNR